MRLLHDPAFLSATIGTIYDCVREPARWEDTLAGLGALIGARRAFLGLATTAGEAPRIAVMHNLRSVEGLLRWGPVNPMLPLGLIWTLDRAMVASRDVGLAGLRKSRFYQGYVAPRGDLDCIAFTVTQEGNAFGRWLLLTQEDRGPVTDEEAAGLELVAPHIRRAIEISDVLGVQQLSAATYRAALDALDPAVLILDGARRVLHANPRAEQALARAGVFRPRRDGTVAGATPAAERALRGATSSAEARGSEEAVVTATGGEERLLFALRLDLGEGAASPVTLVVLRHPREDTRTPSPSRPASSA
jgi:PAS domain-containing protein